MTLMGYSLCALLGHRDPWVAPGGGLKHYRLPVVLVVNSIGLLVIVLYRKLFLQTKFS